MEGDFLVDFCESKREIFQSTPSAWRETSSDWISRRRPDISIHSLRVEGDYSFPIRNIIIGINFNPLPPHGGRPTGSTAFSWVSRYFNPLPPHGGRPAYAPTPPPCSHFNPLPPHGGRQNPPGTFLPAWPFQSTPSAWRETGIHQRL